MGTSALPVGALGTARPGWGPALTPHVGRGFAEPPPHKLQLATRERSSGRGVDELRGFKLVLGSWRKKQKKTRAETWQGTGRQPSARRGQQPTAPSPRGHGARQRTGTEAAGGRGGGDPPVSPRDDTGEAMATSHLHPHILHRYVHRSFAKAAITTLAMGLVSPPPKWRGWRRRWHPRQPLYLVGHSSLPVPFAGTGDTQRGKKLLYPWYSRSPQLLHRRTSFTASKLQVHYLCLT